MSIEIWNTFSQHKANTEISSTNKYQHQLMIFIKTAPFGIKSFPYLNERMSFFYCNNLSVKQPIHFLKSIYAEFLQWRMQIAIYWTLQYNSTSTILSIKVYILLQAKIIPLTLKCTLLAQWAKGSKSAIISVTLTHYFYKSISYQVSYFNSRVSMSILSPK